MFELNLQQKYAAEESEKWYRSFNKQTFEISGPAGSGKTTIILELTRRLGLSVEEIAFVAYVGKAAMILSMKGNNAKTIHSTIYNVIDVPRYDEEGKLMMKNGRVMTHIGFELKPSLDPRVKLLVVDEGSMVNEQVAKDILSFGLPVIVLGDLNQLPPVFGDPYFLNNPDVVLTQIMRQKEDDPIIRLSQMAIKGERLKIGRYGPKCFVIGKDMMTDRLMMESDIIICGKNQTRENINAYYRSEILGIQDLDSPRVGEKIICRQNNWKLSLNGGIFLINGLIGYIDALHLSTFDKQKIDIDFRPEFLQNDRFENISMDYKYLFQPLTDNRKNRFNFANKFQFAYAVTAHLAQGSQYPNVLVYDERIGDWEFYRKWLYTAITRAESGLVVAV